jgi:hypothetical protein
MRTDIPSMLDYVLGEQGRTQPAPEETALMQASQGLPIMVAGGPDDAAKRTWLQKVFGMNRPGMAQPPQQPQSPQDAAQPVEGLASPGSIADQIRQRREAADAAGREVSMTPSDMVYAQNDTGTRNDANADRYSGVSVQTRAGLDKLGREDPTGDLGSMIVGRSDIAAPGGYAAKTTVRGKQTSKQEDALTKMLMNRGMKEADARARARSIK